MSLNRDELEFTVNFMESNCVQFLSMGERLKENNLWEISERSEYLQSNFWHLQWALAWAVREISPCTTGQLEQDSFLWKARCQPQKLLSSAGTARFPMELLDTLMMTNRLLPQNTHRRYYRGDKYNILEWKALQVDTLPKVGLLIIKNNWFKGSRGRWAQI